MENILFDTLSYANKLKTVGVPEKQAEVQAETLAQFIENNLATKRDIKEIETELKRDIKELETELKRDIKELETELKRDIKELEAELKRDFKELEAKMEALADKLTIRLGGMLVIGIGVLAAIMKLL